MKKVADTDIPAPDVYFLERDTAYFGCPFVIMERIVGNRLHRVTHGDRYTFVSGGINLSGTVGVTLRLLSEKRIETNCFVTDKVPLTDIQQAFENLVSPDEQLKILVYP
jgi:hypothetical protein